MVNGPGRGRLQYLSFVVGSALGGLTTGAMLLLVWLLLPDVPTILELGVLAIGGVVALARDLKVIRLPLWQNARQVRQSVIGMPPVTGSLMFGFELGTGLRTFVTGTAPYLLAVVTTLAADSASHPMLVGLAYGTGRGMLPIDRALARDQEAWDRVLRTITARVFPAVVVFAVVLTTAFAVTEFNW